MCVSYCISTSPTLSKPTSGEAGRAGRDGEKAYAVILYTKTDKTTLHRRIVDTFPDKEYIPQCTSICNITIRWQWATVSNVYVNLTGRVLPEVQILPGSGRQCAEDTDSSRLSGIYGRTGQRFPYSFTIRRDELYKLREMGTEAEALIQMILRSYTGVFTDYAYISEATPVRTYRTDP